MTTASNKNYASALYSLTMVFFFWGFLAGANGVFIPFCKSHFNLTQFESQLIDSSFYGAYYIGSLLLYLYSSRVGYDFLNRIGYKKGIIYGLLISVVGAVGMIPAVNSTQYIFILMAFFVIALGFSLQQTAANPFAVALGDPATGAHRLSLAGGINSFGTTIGPIIITLILFGTVVATPDQVANAPISSINILYIILAGVFLLVAGFFAIKNMPRVTSDEEPERSNKLTKALLAISISLLVLIIIGFTLPESFGHGSTLALLVIALLMVVTILFRSNNAAQKDGSGWGAMKYPQLTLGMLAIFVYVGVEVTIQSNLGALLKTPEFGGYDESQISHFISLYWGSLMIGRWMGAVTVFKMSKRMRTLLSVAVPYLAFAAILTVNRISGRDVSDLYIYAICIAVMIAANFWAQAKPAKLLMALGILGIMTMLIGLHTDGKIGIFAFISGGLVCSIMWPSIFALSITGLGKYTSQGSALLIMMILGGAIIPPLQGSIADVLHNIHLSYWVPVACFAYLAFFAWKVSGILKKQGYDIENINTEGGH
ncbi:MFS transporter [Parapedobacter koreensis]|uniref:MFS transporter, FHS family, L-fucose permease n=1 Tax=Parapedobacter koreensis TaxID=332977 RepID=A0A1H7RCS3_9SPHI|nr:MFS transporter [Parapedobacter koreensis]SEL58140.1 MFS transporter, FHS family, L-fucose permease [Parapedobacter koreensis]